MDIAIIRPVSRSIQNCELTHMDRTVICPDTAQAQHDQYARTLESLGVQVQELPPLHDHPDAVFVEDTVVVVDEVAVLTRPGAASRRGEVESMRHGIEKHRSTVQIDGKATLEGGDVIQVGRTIYVGRSTRTNDEGIRQLVGHLEPHGYDVKAVPVPGALHLKTACAHLGNGRLIANPNWIDVSLFHGLDIIEVHEDEPFAGNAVQVNDTLIFSSQYPQTASRLERHGLTLALVDSSELAKAEGSLTCKSVLLRRMQ
ncbi:MAG: arginine deiminase family protein [Phycisphaerales bacterium]|nr:arginine deiminase family protein [Phycisphaerales bacterium]